MSRAQADSERCEVASDQTDHSENRFSGPQRRVRVYEMSAVVFAECDLERPVCQRQVYLRGEDGHVGICDETGRSEVAAERAHLVAGARHAVGGPVG